MDMNTWLITVFHLQWKQDCRPLFAFLHSTFGFSCWNQLFPSDSFNAELNGTLNDTTSSSKELLFIPFCEQFWGEPPVDTASALQAAMRQQFQSKLLKSVYLTTIASILLKRGTDIDLHPLRMSWNSLGYLLTSSEPQYNTYNTQY